MSQGKTRNKLFSFVVNDDESASLEELAKRLQRTKSDAVRVALRLAVNAVRMADAENQTANDSSRSNYRRVASLPGKDVADG